MSLDKMSSLSKYIEPILHLGFWLLYFSAINVSWFDHWLDTSLRPKSPAPLSVLIFPIFFYANAFWLIPRYLNRKDWLKYLMLAVCVFILPEVLRILFTGIYNENLDYYRELFSRDSFLFGAPSVFFIALNSSFVYRFALDWFRNRSKIDQLQASNENQKPVKPYENAAPLTESEGKNILSKLNQVMSEERLFEDATLSLRSLATAVDTTDKKLSYILNQSLSSNFYDYVNKLRVEEFKKRLADGESEQLSLVGLAMECGFKSKSSFYRAFKAEVGSSPSEYLKNISK